MRQDVATSFTDCAARLADLGRHVPAPLLRSRLAWPLAVTAVTLTWPAVSGWRLIAAVAIRLGSPRSPR